jgi:hypothetical protein
VDRAELAAVRGARKGNGIPFEVLIATGQDGFRPPPKKGSKPGQRQQQEQQQQGTSMSASMQDSASSGTNDSLNTSRRTRRADGGKHKAPPMHKSLLHYQWPDLSLSTSSVAAAAAAAGGGGGGDGSDGDYSDDDDDDEVDGSSGGGRAGLGITGAGTMYMPSADLEGGHFPALTARDPPVDIVNSAKNLVLKNSGGGATQLQLAKIGDNEWLLDFWAPVTPLQAFGIALVAFEHNRFRH